MHPTKCSLSPLLSLLTLLIIAGCNPADPTEPDGPGPDSPDAPSCEELLDAWDTNMGEPDPDATPLLLGPGMLRDVGRNEVRALADGEESSSEVVEVGSSIVLAASEARFVHAVRYTPRADEAPLTDFEIYLSPSPDCWGEPVATGRFDGSHFAQEVAIASPRRSAYIRIDVLGGDGGADRVGIAELGILVDAEFESEPDPSAIAGVEWRYRIAADLPGHEPILYEVLEGPGDMVVDDAGLVSWLPDDGDAGSHDVTLRATRGETTLDQAFTLDVSGRQLVGTASTPAGGGEVVIDTSSESSMGASEVVVTVEDADAPAGTVEIHAVEPADEAPEDDDVLTPIGVPFMIDTDLPDGTVITVRIPFASIPGLPTDDPGQSVYFAAYPQESVAHGHEPSGRWGWWEAIKDAVSASWSWVVGEDPEVFQINEGVSITYTIDEFEITYMMGSTDTEAAVMNQLMWVGSQLVSARQHFAGRGCRPRSDQTVVIKPLKGPVGRVNFGSLLFEIDKGHLDGDPRTSVQATIAHELLHTYQLDRAGGTVPGDEFWWVEGTAAFSEDEVFDTNDWDTFYGPWQHRHSSVGITGWKYRNIGYWKSLKATRGFNECQFIDAYVSAGNGVDALSSVVGGDDEVVESVATYTAAYNHVREPSVLDDATVFFSASDAEFGTSLSGTVGTDGYREYRWTDTASASPGGHSAQLKLKEEGSMEIEVKKPTSEFHVLVYDSGESLLGEIGPGDGVVSFDVSGDAVYLDLGTMPNGSVSDIEVIARLMAAPQCASSGAPCSGSGPAFDDECCDDQICVVGACRPNSGGRERASCTDTLGCASGLICNEVGSAEAADTCCARDTDYCEGTADCCGLMECVGNRCVGKTSGEACLSGDCVGVSFCDGGTCT